MQRDDENEAGHPDVGPEMHVRLKLRIENTVSHFWGGSITSGVGGRGRGGGGVGGGGGGGEMGGGGEGGWGGGGGEGGMEFILYASVSRACIYKN